MLLKRANEKGVRFETKLKKIKRLYPSSPIKWDDKSNNIATSLNRMIKDIKTEYFMVLEPDVSLSDKENEGLATLWDALERYPEIDFIGGSYLSGDKLHITCQRFKFCKWTFVETYQYKRSLDHIMICDGTSASFVGRKQSVKKVQNGFDENMSDMLVIKDFFIRAKTANVVVATRPSFMLLADGFKSMYDKWQSHDITKDLVPFAVKHKVFIFKDEEGNLVDLCSSTSPLSGKDLCIEKNAHQLMLDNKHWAYQGLYTYPFLLDYLKVSLREVTNFLEEHNVNYDFFGGVSLGAVKMHSILPWEAGDIDLNVYGMDVPQLLNLLQPWVSKKGYVMREHVETNAVHVFCTPKEIGDVSGGLATMFPTNDPPPEYIRIKTNGIWVRYPRNVFQVIMKRYGISYLEHKLYRTKNAIECKMKGHNACLPNFKSIFNGKGGTYQEYFCEN
ncbi:uncharacterized protein LOC114524873 isoform X1 [Dendronephthya gigantea]|uniref:uncharacterized protein LOC114524873 isoform X1 n=1 Tax=Dendronephthya gigantea TaxID=151771 RepID=UPI00106AB2AC|nr:uncharacterized protein LOC114524873 isoform X1 [Dendronephthya gigantea]